METSFDNPSSWEDQEEISQVPAQSQLHSKEKQPHNMKFLEILQNLNLLTNLFKHGKHFHTMVLEIT